jgi:hypothetical protein
VSCSCAFLDAAHVVGRHQLFVEHNLLQRQVVAQIGAGLLFDAALIKLLVGQQAIAHGQHAEIDYAQAAPVPGFLRIGHGWGFFHYSSEGGQGRSPMSARYEKVLPDEGRIELIRRFTDTPLAKSKTTKAQG